ncbi:MAG: hypothetical protein IPM23_20560 [Candidatus Melainabacteria bacterium]|nr:hypothetical protein [Candidatus Melainabacteria bacterium]
MGIEARADKGKSSSPGPAAQSGLSVFDAFNEVDNDFANVAELDLSDDLLQGLSSGPADADLKLARDLAGFGPRSDSDFNDLVDRGEEGRGAESGQPAPEPAAFSVNPEKDLPQVEVVEQQTETARIPSVTEDQMTASVDRAKNLLPAGSRLGFENRMGMVGDRLSSLT